MITNSIHSTELQSSVQTLRARVELYNGSALARVCNCGDILRDFTVDRAGEGKFFGFGICQRLKTALIGTTDNFTADRIEASFGVNGNFLYPFPVFYITDTKLDEEEEILEITAHDALYKAANYTVNDLQLLTSYTLRNFVGACAALLGLPVRIDEEAAEAFNITFPTGANFGGTETIREALNAAAEATQTIYYINGDWELYFKRLKKDESAVTTIDRNQYFELTNEGERYLAGIIHTTEMGDNLEPDITEPTITQEGDIQYIRDNPFWSLREDASTLVDNAQKVVEGTTINQFSCEWLGNYLLEIGDKIELITKKNLRLTTYLLSDAISFDGALNQTTNWTYGGSEADSALTNPTNLGDAINQTFARVDKASRKITLLAQEQQGLNNKYAALELTTNGLAATVEETNERVDGVEKRTGNFELTASGLSASFEQTTERVAVLEEDSATKEELNGAIEKLSSDFKLDAVEGLLTFQKEIETNGVSQVSGTGFRFSADGLEINKTDAPTSTLIDETGMTVSNNNSNVLEANDKGVSAKNLHATTYIFIGANSRLETYTNGGEERTACFWVGR